MIKGNRSHRPLPSAEMVSYMYHEQKMSAYAIANVYGCHANSVYSKMKRIRSPRRNQKRSSAARKLPDNETLKRHYWIEGLASGEIAKLYHCSRSAVLKQLTRSQIPRREPGRHRPRVFPFCIQCDKPVCEIKRMYGGRYRWTRSIRCRIHAIEFLRYTVRRARGYKNPRAFRITPKTYANWIRDRSIKRNI